MTYCSALNPIGILDIGSNSIRLCVYDTASRVPVPLFNEKEVCSLALGLESSGILNAAGLEPALNAIGRFVALSQAMNVQRLEILATAAVRDAKDGQRFADTIQQRFNVKVNILSGKEEAHLAAMGVLCGTPDAQGIVCDMGGGSLELVSIDQHEFGPHVTMPLGLLRLTEASGDDRDRARQIIEGHLDQLPWLNLGKDQNLYAVGGAWRSLARIAITFTRHHLTVLDNFTLSATEALDITHLVATQSRRSLEKIPGVSRKRIPGLPMAALVLESIIKRIDPSRLVFSIYGMREGRFYETLPPELQAQDPLLSVCRRLAACNSRFPEHGEELMAWMAPLYWTEAPHLSRLRHAACLLSDAFWNEHPDYRAEQSLLRILRLPFTGVTHAERAAIAMAVFTRYQGNEDIPAAVDTIQMLDLAALTRARQAGNILRLAHTMTGGAPNILNRTQLHLDNTELFLDVPVNDPAWKFDPDRSFDRLARIMGCTRSVIRRVG